MVTIKVGGVGLTETQGVKEEAGVDPMKSKDTRFGLLLAGYSGSPIVEGKKKIERERVSVRSGCRVQSH